MASPSPLDYILTKLTPIHPPFVLTLMTKMTPMLPLRMRKDLYAYIRNNSDQATIINRLIQKKYTHVKKLVDEVEKNTKPGEVAWFKKIKAVTRRAGRLTLGVLVANYLAVITFLPKKIVQAAKLTIRFVASKISQKTDEVKRDYKNYSQKKSDYEEKLSTALQRSIRPVSHAPQKNRKRVQGITI